jgi:hypothetical protein
LLGVGALESPEAGTPIPPRPTTARNGCKECTKQCGKHKSTNAGNRWQGGVTSESSSR